MLVAASPREERIKAIHDAFIALMWISRRQFVQRLQSFGLTHPQFVALAVLAAHKQPCTMSDLITVTLQDAPTMTGIIDRLVKVGLAERTRSEIDRRVVLVQASPAGIELVSQIEAQTLTEAQCNFATMSDEELGHYEELLRRILQIHVGRYTLPQEADLEAEINKLRLFKSDPIRYAKSENVR
ncbi:MAG: MarR family transcriptional regulator [Anaerolineae bacterium]